MCLQAVRRSHRRMGLAKKLMDQVYIQYMLTIQTLKEHCSIIEHIIIIELGIIIVTQIENTDQVHIR